MKNKNPFLYGQYLRPKYFCDRKKETEIILSQLEQNRNVLLVGRNGLGKTTLIKHIFHFLDKNANILPIRVDLFKTTSLNNFIEELLNSTIRKIEESSIKKFKKLKKTIFYNSKDELLSLETLGEIELKDKINQYLNFLISLNKKVIISVDNYQDAVRFPSSKFREIFISKLSTDNNVCLLFSGSKKTINDKSFNLVEINKIPTEEYRKFIIKNFSSAGFSINEKSIKKIFEFSGRETSTTQLVCTKIIDYGEKKIKSKIVDTVINNILLESTPKLEMIKHLLSPYQWKLLLAIAIEGEATFVTSNSFISKYKLNAPSSVKTALDALIDKELIYRSLNSYFISNSLFRCWLVSK